MSEALDIMHDLRAAGVSAKVDGDDILLSGKTASITGEQMQRIRTHKPELLAHLQAANSADADLDELIAERAAILEFDGGLSRDDAERIAKGAHAEYLNHLMAQRRTGCGCVTNLGALVARFCPEGQRLRDAYNLAVEDTA